MPGGKISVVTTLVLAFLLDVSAEESEVREPPRGPDHLIPSDPGSADDFFESPSARYREPFKLEKFAFARMILVPSFPSDYRKESATIVCEFGSFVSLHGEDLDRDAEAVTRFYLTAGKVELLLPEGGDFEKDRKSRVISSTLPLEKALALRLIRIWTRMLDQSRASREPHGGFDGVTYEFSIPGKSATTWLPDPRLSTGIFAELGSYLTDYAMAKESARADKLKQVETAATRLEEYLDKHSAK